MSISLDFKRGEIFISYNPHSMRDRNSFQDLIKHLAPLKNEHPDLKWSNSNTLEAGKDIDQSFEDFLNTANIIVLLISPDYLGSEHCYHVEMQPILTRYNAGNVCMIPVLLRHIDTGNTILAPYHLLPANGVPVDSWSKRDKALAEIATAIRLAVGKLMEAAEVHSHADSRSDFVSTPSYGDNIFFTDRETVLARISSSFASAPKHDTPILALNGPPGIGKTQIAQAYASHSRSSQIYQKTFWLNASSLALLSKDVSTYAARFSLPEGKNEKQLFITFKQWLQEKQDWLLVLDSLEEINLIDLVIPSHSKGHVLLTTRKQATGRYGFSVAIKSMDTDAGALFLLRRAKILRSWDSLEQATPDTVSKARAIAQALKEFPLALEQAGAYIEETRCSLTTYLSLYQTQRTRIFSEQGQLADDDHQSVMGAFNLVFRQVAQTSAVSLDLLHLLAFLHPDAIFDELFLNGALVLPGALRTLVADSQKLLQTFAILLNCSLISWNAESNLLQIHRLVQDVLVDMLTKRQQRRWAQLAVRLVNHVFPEASFENWNDCQRYLPHAQQCAALITKYQLTLKEGALLLERLGTYRFRKASYTEAETYLTQALNLYEHHLHTDTLDASQAMNSLALLHTELAHYQKAKALHVRALELREQEQDAEHPKTIESLHNLAMLYGDEGRYKLAENIYLRILPLEERSKGPDHPDVAKTLNNLALMYFYQKRYSEAETTYHRALTIYECLLSPDHPDHPNLIHTLDGLGSLAEQRRNYQQAEQFYQRALAMSKNTWGVKHPETAHCINKLAGIAELYGDNQKAEEFYQQALTIGEQALGSDHPDVALFLNNLAFLANKQGQYQKAELLYQRVLSIYKRPQRSKHPNMALFLNNIGRFYRNIKNEEQAEVVLKRALALQKRFLDPTDPDITLSLNNLADVLIDQQRDEEAAPLLHRALAILLLRASGPEHPDVELIREKYASLLERLHRNEEAKTLRQDEPKQEGQSSAGPTPEDL